MKWPALPRFSRAEVLFSLKSFSAAMLAMYIANRAGLPRPFWSMLTCYIVSAPLAGNVRSKALFRFFGTLIGCTATVALVPMLSSAPELLTLALALWVGTCLYISLLDRTARSYVFMLAGYTAALIGFPSVESPLGLFDNAVSRVEEIGLGILCATLVHSIVLPVGLGPTLLGLMDRSLGDARKWFADVLRPASKAARTRDSLVADRQRLAGDITQLRLLSIHVPFDTGNLRWTAGAIGTMQDNLAGLTPALSAVEDRLHALVESEGRLPDDVAAVLAQATAWLHADADRAHAGTPPPDRDAELEALRASFRQLGEPATGNAAASDAPAEAPTTTPWCRALRIGLAVRLDELATRWRACETLRQRIDEGLAGGPAGPRHTGAFGTRVLHRDTGLALLSAFAAVLAICLLSAIWIVTAWPSGSVLPTFAAVFCSFFATMDDPVPAIKGFMKFTILSTPISALYVLVLLPVVHDFGMLMLVCLPVFFVLGALAGRATTAPAALAMILGVAGTLSIHDTSNVDLPLFLNSTLGQVLAILGAATVTHIVRSVGGDWVAARIRRATWNELGDMAAAARSADVDEAYAVRMVDRIGLLAPRVAQEGPEVRNDTVEGALRDLRSGVDIVALQRARAQLPSMGIGTFMTALSRRFRDLATGQVAPPSAALLSQLDAVLAAALVPPVAGEPRSADARAAITALVGLRRSLFPDAPAHIAAAAAHPIPTGAPA